MSGLSVHQRGYRFESYKGHSISSLTTDLLPVEDWCMVPSAHIETKVKSLKDPAVKEKLQQLRQTDNYTNFYYLALCYLYLVVVLGGTIGFYHYRAAAGVAFVWNVPVTLLAMVLVGAGQHQLMGLTHEAAHHILFRNRH